MAPVRHRTSTSGTPGVLIADHYVEPEGYQVVRPGGTEDYLIAFTLSGQGRFLLGERTWTCRFGDLVIVPPGTPHHYETAEGETWNFVWAHFLPMPEWRPLLHSPGARDGMLHLHVADPDIRKRLLRLFKWMIRDTIRMSPRWEDLTLAALQTILLLFNEQRDRGRNLDPRTEEALSLMSKMMHESLTVDRLAKAVSLSPSRFAHLFKEETGQSVMEMLASMRLRHAARLLAFSTRSVSEIAFDVGYRSYANFLKQFKAYWGMSPADYRKNRRQSR